MKLVNVISAVAQAVCGLVLTGLSIYYFTLEDYPKFGVFLGVGIVFVALPVRSWFRYKKQRDAERRTEEENNPKKGGFL